MPRKTCTLCAHPDAFGKDSDSATIRSNVRAYQEETFTLWRCSNCQSIHLYDDIDLDHYYEHYPMRGDRKDFIRWFVSWQYLRRLKRHGLERHAHLLDYGSGSGVLVDAFTDRGYEIQGYDPFIEGLNNPDLLQAEGYDCVILQDVIEHDEDPQELLETVVQLIKPGGLLALGTPDAETIGLSAPESYIHSLHAPYHLHILPRSLLIDWTQQEGLSLLWHSGSPYETPFPFINRRFLHHYTTLHDNTLDLGYEPYRINWRLFTPRSLFYALLGSFFPPYDEFFGIFRKAEKS